MADGKLARILYRSLLRASRNGRCPEVYGEYVATAAPLFPSNVREGAVLPPSTAKQVRRLVREMFARPTDENQPRHDAFAVLRHANQLSSILHPSEEILRRARLPVFDFGAAAAMFGEELQLNFFEKRYLELARRATQGEGFFVLRARPVLDDADGSSPPSSLSVLMKIVEHTDPDAKVINVRCIAGPRLRVLDAEQPPSLLRLDKEEPRMIVAKVTLNRDIGLEQTMACMPDINLNHDHRKWHDHQKWNAPLTIQLAKMRSRCLDILCAVTTEDSLFSFGLPPLDPEHFSFWSLRHVLHRSDTDMRHTWISCRSTMKRLEFIITLLEKFQEAKRGKGNAGTQ